MDSLIVNPHKNGPFDARCRMAKNKVFACSVFSLADPKIFSENTHKMSKSQQLIDIKISLKHNFYYSGFNFLDLLIKLNDDDDALVHLVQLTCLG